jgi:hypothetical protein
MLKYLKKILPHWLWLILLANICSTLAGCALALEYPLTSASLGIWGATGKSPSDHAMSYVTDEDCQTLRLINSDQVCKKTTTAPIEVVDKSVYKR